jgi:hypothetical protein
VVEDVAAVGSADAVTVRLNMARAARPALSPGLEGELSLSVGVSFMDWNWWLVVVGHLPA